MNSVRLEAQQNTTAKKRELSVNQCAFLAAFAQCGTVTFAAQAAKVDRTRHYAWLKDDHYSEAFKVAQAAAAGSLEKEARRAGGEGIRSPDPFGVRRSTWPFVTQKPLQNGCPFAVTAPRHRIADDFEVQSC